jgi:hypothetical protein
MKIQLDFGSSCHSFAVKKWCKYSFELIDFCKQYSHSFVFKRLIKQTVSLFSSKIDQLVHNFPKLFSDKLGTMKGVICD